MSSLDPSQKLTSIIIPVHNRRTLTLGCLEHLRWVSLLPDWKIILVDDGSTDGTAEAVREQYPHVEITTGDGNLYWTGGIAHGMRRAVDLGATEFIWLNDDTDPDEASLRRLSRLVREDPTLVVASTVLVNEEVQATCSLRFKAAHAVPGTLQPADTLAGYLVAFSVEVVRRIGYPDQHRWPHYAGDGSYTHHAHRAGFKVRVDGDSFIRLRDHVANPSPGEVFWKGERYSITERFRRSFLETRARYRAATSWHLDLMTRGLGRSLFIFPARMVFWAWDVWKCRPTHVPQAGGQPPTS